MRTNFNYKGLFFKLNIENVNKRLIMLAILIITILEIAVLIAGLYIINWCWDCPNWLSVTPKHILGIFIVLHVLNSVTNSKDDKN